MKHLIETHDKQNAAYAAEKAEKINTAAVTAEWKQLATKRVDELLAMLGGIADVTALPYVEALDILASLFDDIIVECAIVTNRRAEVESAIIALCKKAVAAAPSRDAANEQSIAKLLDCLAETPSAEAGKKMGEAVLDVTNPLRLGLIEYLSFCEKNPSCADTQAKDYLTTEATAREQLICGDLLVALGELEKLMQSPIKSPEKYLLVALGSFYHGLNDDAMRSIEIGLENYPNDQRLLDSQNALKG